MDQKVTIKVLTQYTPWHRRSLGCLFGVSEYENVLTVEYLVRLPDER